MLVGRPVSLGRLLLRGYVKLREGSNQKAYTKQPTLQPLTWPLYNTVWCCSNSPHQVSTCWWKNGKQWKAIWNVHRPIWWHTLDGRNPAPVDMETYFQGFIHVGWCRIYASNSIMGWETIENKLPLVPIPGMVSLGMVRVTPWCTMWIFSKSSPKNAKCHWFFGSKSCTHRKQTTNLHMLNTKYKHII